MKASTSSDKKNMINCLILGMGIAYSLFLAWVILYKCGAPFIGDGTDRAINLLPFNNNTNWEMQFNIAVFMPFGFYHAAIRRKLALIKQVLAVLLVSVFFEMIQFVLAIGRSDITDLLMNTFGGVIGITGFYVVSKLFGKHERKATLVICVLLTLLELYMTVSFILFEQLNIGFMIIRL